MAVKEGGVEVAAVARDGSPRFRSAGVVPEAVVLVGISKAPVIAEALFPDRGLELEATGSGGVMEVRVRGAVDGVGAAAHAGGIGVGDHASGLKDLGLRHTGVHAGGAVPAGTHLEVLAVAGRAI